MKYFKALTALLFILILQSCASRNDAKKRAMDANAGLIDSTGMKDDIRFAVAAADGGMLEIELGRLAQVNAAADIVKVFGSVMMEDHTKAAEQLKGIADAKSIVLPAALGQKSKKLYDKLAGKKGEAFDKAYISMMVDDHENDVKEFSEQAEKGKDDALKKFAADKTPVLKEHLQMARTIDSTLRNLRSH